MDKPTMQWNGLELKSFIKGQACVKLNEYSTSSNFIYQTQVQNSVTTGTKFISNKFFVNKLKLPEINKMYSEIC